MIVPPAHLLDMLHVGLLLVGESAFLSHLVSLLLLLMARDIQIDPAEYLWELLE